LDVADFIATARPAERSGMRRMGNGKPWTVVSRGGAWQRPWLARRSLPHYRRFRGLSV